MFRTLVRFSIAVLIGVGATLGWQSYGDEAKEMLVARGSDAGSAATCRSTPKSLGRGCGLPRDTTRQLAPLASTLDAVRRSVEQLAAKQEQMAQNIAALRGVDEDARHKTSSAPPAPAQQAASIAAAQNRRKPRSRSRLPPPAGAGLALTNRNAGDGVDAFVFVCRRVRSPFNRRSTTNRSRGSERDTVAA